MFQDAKGRLRVRVNAGTNIATTLCPGEMNYLTAILQIQRILCENGRIDDMSTALLATHCDSRAPTDCPEINCCDPWLFSGSSDSTAEGRHEFYVKVWRLLNHRNHQITFAENQPMKLKLVIPNFSRLVVSVMFTRGVRSWGIRVLYASDKENSSYTLSRYAVQGYQRMAMTKSLATRIESLCKYSGDHHTSHQIVSDENNKQIRETKEDSSDRKAAQSNKIDDDSFTELDGQNDRDEEHEAHADDKEDSPLHAQEAYSHQLWPAFHSTDFIEPYTPCVYEAFQAASLDVLSRALHAHEEYADLGWPAVQPSEPLDPCTPGVYGSVPIASLDVLDQTSYAPSEFIGVYDGFHNLKGSHIEAHHSKQALLTFQLLYLQR